MNDLDAIAKFVYDHDRVRLRSAVDNLGIDLSAVDLSLANTPEKVHMNDLTNVILQAQAAALPTVYYTPSAMVANGRYTLLTFADMLPQVLCNPAGVGALAEACAAAGIECVAMTPEMTKL